jgi:dTDP-glucose pyrophosphorylase/thiamine kinase-like enzyme
MIGIIPAAGRGIRFKELGKHYSKTILPYKEKPILIHQIEWLEQHGCTDIRVVLNHAEDTVKDILALYNKNVTICRQEERNGLAGAILSAAKITDDSENVLVLLGDLIVQDVITPEMFTDNFISVKEVPDYSRWCMVQTDADGHCVKFIDKPSTRPDTILSVSGVYHFTSANQLFTLLSKQLSDETTKIAGEYQISTVLQWIAETSYMSVVNLSMIDFGTLEEYLENRSVKISRSFNDIQIDGSFITKSSEKEREKLIKEYNWFMNLPEEIQVMTPRIFNKELFTARTWYKMEKVKAPSVREIYLFLDSSEETWDVLFDAMITQLHTMKKYGQPNKFMSTVLDKTKSRINDIEIPIENKLVNEFMEDFESEVISMPQKPTLMHGDYCFSNLLYDFNGNITMIDPRGDLFGDHYYEVAKLCHSILFDYDFVDAELYVKDGGTYQLYNKGKENIKELFKLKINKYYSEKEIRYIMYICASLFLSMIPLHAHNRNNQEIYYDIFKRIYNILRNDDDIRITRKINS